jgi:hypothetical protein
MADHLGQRGFDAHRLFVQRGGRTTLGCTVAWRSIDGHGFLLFGRERFRGEGWSDRSFRYDHLLTAPARVMVGDGDSPNRFSDGHCVKLCGHHG